MTAMLQREGAARVLLELAQLFQRGVPARSLDRLVRETIFFLYEGGESEKWAWHRPHSGAARELHRLCRKQGGVFRGGRQGPWQVTYEHAVPLAALRATILSASSATQILEILDTHVQGVIVTNAENERLSKLHRSTMPTEARKTDLLARYRAANIKF